MSVLVTYEVKVANLSTTLPITVHNIINSYDSEYTLNTSGWSVVDKQGFKQATSGDLNISVKPQEESDAIELTYTVSMDAIRNLLNQEATLNNAVEIGSYSVRYGEKTLYAEQRSGGKNNKPYAGYDYDSHPGNAGIFINNEGRLEDKLLKDTKRNIVRVDNNGKQAILNYKKLKEKDSLTLVEIKLETGRSHQIRVQMSHNKTPLFGDQKYNKNSKVGEQLALFAKKLEFYHPITKELMSFELALPNREPFIKFK